MPNIQGFSTLRARSYVLRLPLFTRGLIVVITAFYFAGLLPLWDLRQWGALIPDQMNIFTCQYRSPCPARSVASDISVFWEWGVKG